MKGNLILVLSLLVVGIYSSSITNLVHTLSKSSNPTARFISSFVQFHQAGETTPASYKALFEALDLVTQFLEESRSAKIAEKNQQSGIHDSLVSEYNNQITQYTIDWNNAKSYHASLLTQQEELKNRITELNRNLEGYKTEKNNIIETRKSESAAFAELQDSLNEAISACQEALNVLNNVQKSIKSTSFLQTNANSGKVFIDLLERKVLKSWEKTRKGDKLSFHMIKTLAQAVSKQSFSSPELVDKAIELVNTLLKRFQDDLTAAQLKESQAIQQYETDLLRINNDITNTQNEIDVKTTELKNVEELIPIADKAITDAKDKLDLANQGLIDENEKWTKYLASYNSFITEVDYEVGIVADTISALREGGISA